MAEQIMQTEYSELMQKSYIDYSMSVITARAVPDVRDGHILAEDLIAGQCALCDGTAWT